MDGMEFKLRELRLNNARHKGRRRGLSPDLVTSVNGLLFAYYDALRLGRRGRLNDTIESVDKLLKILGILIDNFLKLSLSLIDEEAKSTTHDDRKS